MRVIALIPAAGMGKRMAAGMNKQYLLLGYRPILAHTIAVFESAPFVDDIYLVIPEDEIPYCRENVVERFGFTKVRRIVAGGSERQHSVLNGLRAVEQPGAVIRSLSMTGFDPLFPCRLSKAPLRRPGHMMARLLRSRSRIP